MTKSLSEDESLLMGNRVEFYNNKQPKDLSNLNKYIKQSAQSGFLGWNPSVGVYNLGNGSGKGFDKFVKKLGNQPVVFDKDLVNSSVSNIKNHLQYMGYYKSDVSDTVTTKNKRTYVTYTVRPGKEYKISDISIDMPEELYGSVDEVFSESYISKGDKLSEYIIDKEANRITQLYRNSGFFAFNKNFIYFTADTLTHDGNAKLDISIKEYTRNQTIEDSKPHLIYHFDKILINSTRSYRQRESNYRYDDSLYIARRDSLLNSLRFNADTIKYKGINVIKRGQRLLLTSKFLDRINTIKEGDVFSQQVVEDTYTRFSSIPLFSTVNINLEERDSALVRPIINLQTSSLQGYKLNLQGSVNSNGLFGVSPAVSYYHKNLFRGAELFTLGLSGDFQFKPKDNIRSTEFGVVSSVDIPKFVFAPDRWFRSTVIPHTEITASYNYQTRPEYTRNIISASYGYTWNIRKQFFIKFTPLQANIVKVNKLDSTFYKTLNDPYLRNSYKDHFDIGIGTNLYYTSDPSVNPMKSYFYLRYQMDLAGNVISLFNRSFKTDSDGERLIWGAPYSQYFKMELSGVYTYKFGSDALQALSFRLLGGVGKGYGNSKVVPFEKLLWGGGAYSLRGWQARTLGPGYAPRDSAFKLPNQSGDIRLEANVEYRFPMFWLLKGALFADAGNIWTFDRGKDESTQADSRGVFKFNNFYRHIALDWGVGLRLDITYAILRLDVGFKTFNPATSKWVVPSRWLKGDNYEISFGIGYPF